MIWIYWGAGGPNSVFTPVENDIAIILHEAADAVVPYGIRGVGLPDDFAMLGTIHGIVSVQEAPQSKLTYGDKYKGVEGWDTYHRQRFPSLFILRPLISLRCSV